MEETTTFKTDLIPAITVDLPYFGTVDLSEMILAFGIFLVLNVIFWILRNVVLIYLKKVSSKTIIEIDDVLVDVVAGIRVWVYTIISIFLALQAVTVPDWLDKTAKAIFLFAVVWQLIEAALKFVSYFSRRFLERDSDGDGQIDPSSTTASHMVDLIARIALWVLGILFILSNLGIEVTSLLAGLGIGGLAVALALQGILSDLFASFSIYLDKPFRVGDFIVVGNDAGTVEKVGVKSTRIRTLQGQELVVSNVELTGARVENYKKMEERRVVTNIGVTYDTPLDKMRQVEEVITDIFKKLNGGRLDRVHFTTLGDFSLIFEIVYYVESADYTDYLNIQQQFNFTLMERFAEMGVEFAYPTQTILTKAAD